jgi:uncharacterized protein YndB with AHSA1/START domain
MREQTRAFETSIDIDASPDDVWRALTEAQELMRWFALEARVVPGPGGSVFLSWGDEAWSSEDRIEAWEPGRRLRLVHEQTTFDADGRPTPAEVTAARPISIEFTLETRQGGTRLRVVHSGFGQGADWDDELEGVGVGWRSELRSLRHYLTRHRGRDRHAGWARLSTPLSQAEVWRRLLGPDGFTIQADARDAGRPFTVRTGWGDALSGTVQLWIPDRDFSGITREHDDGLFRVATHRAAGRTGVMVWLARYGDGDERVRAFGGRAQAVLERLFG